MIAPQVLVGIHLVDVVVTGQGNDLVRVSLAQGKTELDHRANVPENDLAIDTVVIIMGEAVRRTLDRALLRKRKALKDLTSIPDV